MAGPKILRGAFVTFEQSPLGLTGGAILNNIPLIIPFRLNPQDVSRSIKMTYGKPVGSSTFETRQRGAEENKPDGAASIAGGFKLTNLPPGLQFQSRTESISSLKLLLDATDRIADGSSFADGVGVLPELSALEMLTQPRVPLLALGDIFSGLGNLLNPTTSQETVTLNTNLLAPTTLFIWGPYRILPCVVSALTVNETRYDTNLVPTQAEVTVSLDLLQIHQLGASLQNWLAFLYSDGVKKVMATLNYANVDDVANTIIPM